MILPKEAGLPKEEKIMSENPLQRGKMGEHPLKRRKMGEKSIPAQISRSQPQ